ncbi:MAG: hypothetical protein MJA29_04205, partial [Candidatus Omnitrophica bacterium]|nr:hypothetical protein [Candidatus Omnitrophota bacterium]
MQLRLNPLPTLSSITHDVNEICRLHLAGPSFIMRKKRHFHQLHTRGVMDMTPTIAAAGSRFEPR